MNPNQKPGGTGEDVLKSTLKAASTAGRFFSRLRQQYRAGLAGESQASQAAPAPSPRRSPNTRAWWEVLGVRETAAPDEITAAYRELLRKSHPDKVAQLSDRLRQVAEEETQQLNAAYEEARRAVAQRKSV